MKKVVIIDTSILCVWLQLPGFKACGKEPDVWNFQRIEQKIAQEIEAGSTLVLPLATVIETGNHISQLNGDPFSYAQSFCQVLANAVDKKSPWVAFSEQNTLWTDSNLKRLAAEWPTLASQRISIGDATIKDVADFYNQANFRVEIFTGDNGLKSYEPSQPMVPEPRRRKQ